MKGTVKRVEYNKLVLAHGISQSRLGTFFMALAEYSALYPERGRYWMERADEVASKVKLDDLHDRSTA